MTIEEFAERLDALSQGSKVTVSGDEFEALFPAGEPTALLGFDAKSGARHFARACGCTVTFEDETRIGTFTKV